MNKKDFIIAITLLIITTIIIISVSIFQGKGDLEIYFFKAGKADAILISKKDTHILIDAGEKDFGQEIVSYLKENDIDKLDYLIISHFDKDHVGGASTVINDIKIDHIIQNSNPKNNKEYDAYLEALANKEIEISTLTEDTEIEISDLKLAFDVSKEIYDEDVSNNSSLVISLYYNKTSYLFAGDIEEDRIEDFIASNKSTYNVLKVPHHGNYNKKTDDLINLVKPNYSIITSSSNEPEDEKVVKLLEFNKSKVYFTRINPVIVTSNGINIHVKYEE